MLQQIRRPMSHRTLLTLLVTLLVVALLGGCSHYRDLPPGTVKAITTAVVEREEVKVPPPSVEPPPSMDYVIGVNDVLTVNMNGLEFTSGTYGSDSRMTSTSALPSRVDGNGDIHLPYLDEVKASGLTVSQLTRNIRERLKKYFTNPWATIEILAYKSQPLNLLGEFRSTGTLYIDRPLTLLQGVALGGGYTPTANLKKAHLLRDSRMLPVDLYLLIAKGEMQQNIWLKPNDTIVVPDNRFQQVFLFGSVKNPGPIPTMPDGTIPLSRVLMPDFVGGNLNHIRIIRSLTPTTGELIVVDYEKILRGEAASFMLQDGDIVYVPRSTLGTWNDAISEILPSLNAVSSVLQPFINIKYLTRN